MSESTDSEPESAENDEAKDTENNDTQEVVETEVVEEADMQIAEEVEALSTFSEQEGPFSIKVIPVVRDGGTDWRVVAFLRGVQGPVYESTEKISDEAADTMGMSRRLQSRINESLDYADENLEVPPELGDQTRQKRSLSELEMMMDE